MNMETIKDVWCECIQYIATASETIANQANVGAMETAGSIVSYLANNPDAIPDFMNGGSIMDWPIGWHMHGCLTWHAVNGKIVHPEFARRARVIRELKGENHQ